LSRWQVSCQLQCEHGCVLHAACAFDNERQTGRYRTNQFLQNTLPPCTRPPAFSQSLPSSPSLPLSLFRLPSSFPLRKTHFPNSATINSVHPACQTHMPSFSRVNTEITLTPLWVHIWKTGTLPSSLELFMLHTQKAYRLPTASPTSL
jgi:hypothetical protein